MPEAVLPQLIDNNPVPVRLISAPKVEAASDGWQDQPRRKDVGLQGGQWVDTNGPRSGPAQLARSIASGIASTEFLGEGSVAIVEKVRLNDGNDAIRKTAVEDHIDFDPEWQTDSEELASKVAAAIGVKSPAVHRAGDTEVWMEFINAPVAGETLSDADELHLADSDGGRLMGLLDLLIDNTDRNEMNWLIGADGSIHPIDHANSFEYRYGVETPDLPRTVFERHFIGFRPLTEQIEVSMWADNDLSPQDMLTLRDRLSSLRPDFERRGRGDWHDAVMSRVEAISAHATGDRNRIS